MSKAQQAVSKAAESVAGTRIVGRFAGPYAGGVLLVIAGQLLHDRAAHGSLLKAQMLAAVVLLATALLAGVAFIESRLSRYRSDLAKVVLMVRSVTTATAAGVGVFGTMANGWWGSPNWRLAYCVGGVVLGVTWNIGRLAPYSDAKQESGLVEPAGGVLDKVKLSRVKVIEATASKTVVDVTRAPGVSGKDLRDALPTMSQLMDKRVISGGATASARPWEGDERMTFLHEQPLTGDVAWDGPALHGKSVCDGFDLALYLDGEPVIVKPWGDYRTKGAEVGAAHIAEAGMPGSGKGEWARLLIAEYRSRRDSMPVLVADTRKALQFAGPVRAAIGLHADTPAKVKAMLRAVEASGVARAAALGDAGFSKWTPEAYEVLGMPAALLSLEELAAYGEDNVRRLVELGEFLRSTGWIMNASQQRWTSDRASTSFRSSLGNRMVFGADNDDSAATLAEEAVAAGISPGDWGTRYPGRHIAVVNGAPSERRHMMAKGRIGDEALLRQVTDYFGRTGGGYWSGDTEAFAEIAESCRPSWLTGVSTEVATPSAAPPIWSEPRAAEPDEDEAPDYQPTEDEESEYAMKLPDDIPPEDQEEYLSLRQRTDPREPVAAWDGPDVDLTPEPDGRRWSRIEKEEEFAKALAELIEAHPGRSEFSTDEIREAYAARVGEYAAAGGDAFMHEMLGERIDGRLAGQIERLKRSRYRVTALVGAHRESAV